MPEESKVKRFIKTIKPRINDFWIEKERDVVFLIGLILVAVVSFEFGSLQGQKWDQEPMVIEKIAVQKISNAEATSNVAASEKTPPTSSKITAQSCQFVGSKNSNKYHSPNCQWAKRIKPENVVCFKSVEEATSKNYQPDKNCIK